MTVALPADLDQETFFERLLVVTDMALLATPQAGQVTVHITYLD